MTYLVVETFYPEKVKALYQKFDAEGRLLPEGVTFISSWIDESVSICFQVMESETEEKLLEWIEQWKEFADFKIIPVISSVQAKEKVFSK